MSVRRYCGRLGTHVCWSLRSRSACGLLAIGASGPHSDRPLARTRRRDLPHQPQRGLRDRLHGPGPRLQPARLGAARHDLRTPAGLPGQAAAGRDFASCPRWPPASRRSRATARRTRSGCAADSGSATATPVRASAFARAINRMLAPEMNSPGVQYARDIVGAGRVLAGKADDRRRRGRAREHARRPAHAPRARLPAPDGVDLLLRRAADAARRPRGRRRLPGRRPVLRHGVPARRAGRAPAEPRSTAARRPHHVDGFDVDLRAASPQEVLRRVDRGDADWGHTLAGIYFDPLSALVEKYGINRSQLFLRPGLTLRMLAFNSSRPLFRDNPSLRRAVNFALNRRAIVNGPGGPLASRPSDQYLPSTLPGFRDADVYPLERADLQRAKALANGNLRGGKAVLYVNSSPLPMAIGQLVKQQLAEIGLEVEVRGIPIHSASAAYFKKLATPGEPWDLAFGLWSPSYVDPFAYINLLFDRRFVGGTNFTRFASSPYDRADARAARLPQGSDRKRRLRGARRPARTRVRAHRRDRLPQRADARLEARRLHRSPARARSDRRLPQVATRVTAPARRPRGSRPQTTIAGRGVADLDRRHDLVRRRVDPRDGPRGGVRHPDRSAPDSRPRSGPLRPGSAASRPSPGRYA